MEFRTQIPLQEKSPKIGYQSDILLLGSCFVENIGEKLDYYKLRNRRNPFGILYHPLAISKFILKAVNEERYTEDDIFFHNERWHCFDAHSELSNSDKNQLLECLNANLGNALKYLKTASHLIITLGTAWYYELIENNESVANCHKFPQKHFNKKLLKIDQIITSLNLLLEAVQKLNPEITVIFTVSPVRHLKDGIVENQLSKAHLIAAIHQVVNTEGNVKHLHYFPSYEIMMDDLRDYRFYAEDLLHPNVVAINYIWEKFIEIWFSQTATNTLKKVETIQRGLSHKAFNETSTAHQKFLDDLQIKIEKLQNEYSHIQF
ncbi:GSCFA domain-containing protein [Gillisia sp. M10.2A]|uniref:GSCFA domain-containing protein n=1 Tax=Gillisia lutea TaxID=2909668 RepID=A0ABS9EEA2_9FLAO|nr:GSCFA domain-containing protein [Gillisia lutea]MCF4101200.1 GSCFA domain-containing protein [Gillisia lutea]